jgi:hypothetical protein
MKSRALVPLVVVMLSHSSAQAAEAPGPTGPPVSHFQGSCDSDPDGAKFAAKACYTAYDPGQAGYGASYRPPVCDKSTPVTERQREVLAKAYSRAPDYVKARLCRLTQLFVTRPSAGSWGFWEGGDRPPGTGVYIGISDEELGSATAARRRGSTKAVSASLATPGSEKSVADAENGIVGKLLRLADGDRRHRLGLPRLQMAALPDPALPVLAVLAHELGHALLADTNADGTDPRHPRRQVSGPPQSACFDEAFLAASWDPDRFHRHMRRWVGFGEQNQNRQKNPDVEFSLNQLRTAVRAGKIDDAFDTIRSVYRSKEFASFFASVSPEEDFVETYKYRVLADAALDRIGLRLRGQEVNLLDHLAVGILARKVACLRDLGLLTGQP